MNKTLPNFLLISSLALVFLAGCSQDKSNEPVSGRWYTPNQLALGKTIFADNCAACHGANAQSIPNWQQSLADGSYPPPPLNGSAHAWHHPLNLLVRTIEEGGAAVGGKMPAFKNVLNKQEQLAAIAFFQSYWDNRIYQIWKENGGLTK